MLEQAYRREMESVCPDGEQMEKLLAVMGRGRRGGISRRVRTVLVAAAVVAALGVTALAVSPTLREALASALGSFAPYSSAVDGVSVTDNGIRVKVVSALADETGGTVYFEATDLKGDRLGADSAFDHFWLPCISYDAETRTALYACPLQPQDRNEGGTATLSVDRFLSGLVSVRDIKLPWDMLTDARLESLTVEAQGGVGKDKPVLKPNQTPAKLDTDLFSLSSMGFDGDGVFHLQLALADGVELASNDRTELSPNTVELDWGRASGMQWTLFGDGKYVDFYYGYLTVDHFGHFRVDDLEGTLCTRPIVEGDWTLTFPLEVLPERVVTSDVHLYHTRLASFHLSAMSLRLESVLDGTGGTRNLSDFPVWLFLKDGTKLQLEFADFSSLFLDEDGNAVDGGDGLRSGVTHGGTTPYGMLHLWDFPQAVDPQDVVGVSIGQLMMDLDGDTVGEAYWLDEVP